MSRARVVLSVCVLGFWGGGGGGGCAAQPPEESVSADEALVLTSATPAHVAGRFTRDGVTVRFDSVRGGGEFRFELTAGDGSPLIGGELVEQDFVTTVLGGKLRLLYGTTEADGLLDEGDPGAIDELEARREYAILPWLSYELGVRGYNGRDYPAALALHMFNRSVAERTGVVLPQADELAPIGPDGEAGSARCSRPSSNQCYGMCGPGCTCWSFVCGDCCYHYGCARHDNYCRGSGWWDKARCWTTWGAAFFGC